MPHKSVEHTGTFIGREEDGSEHTILEFTTYLEGRTGSGPYRVEGLKELRTKDGDAVNRIEEGKYEIVGGFQDIPLTSDDPRAI